jgi:hypothetical protein
MNTSRNPARPTGTRDRAAADTAARLAAAAAVADQLTADDRIRLTTGAGYQLPGRGS